MMTMTNNKVKVLTIFFYFIISNLLLEGLCDVSELDMKNGNQEDSSEKQEVTTVRQTPNLIHQSNQDSNNNSATKISLNSGITDDGLPDDGGSNDLKDFSEPDEQDKNNDVDTNTYSVGNGYVYEKPLIPFEPESPFIPSVPPAPPFPSVPPYQPATSVPPAPPVPSLLPVQPAPPVQPSIPTTPPVQPAPSVPSLPPVEPSPPAEPALPVQPEPSVPALPSPPAEPALPVQPALPPFQPIPPIPLLPTSQPQQPGFNGYYYPKPENPITYPPFPSTRSTTTEQVFPEASARSISVK